MVSKIDVGLKMLRREDSSICNHYSQIEQTSMLYHYTKSVIFLLFLFYICSIFHCITRDESFSGLVNLLRMKIFNFKLFMFLASSASSGFVQIQLKRLKINKVCINSHQPVLYNKMQYWNNGSKILYLGREQNISGVLPKVTNVCGHCEADFLAMNSITLHM